MIINIDEEEKENENKKEENNNKENNENKIIDDESLENLFGEEEDEDDLLKDKTNSSCKTIDKIYFPKDNNINNNNIIELFNIPAPKIIKESDIENKENNDNKNNENEENEIKSKENKENNEINESKKDSFMNTISSSTKSIHRPRVRVLTREISRRRNNNTDSLYDSDKDEEEEEEEEEEESISINPYVKYTNSKIKYNNNLDKLTQNCAIYEKKTNKYYLFLVNKLAKRKKKICINYEYINKKNSTKIVKIIKNKYMDKSFNEEEDKKIINEINNVLNRPEYLESTIKEENNIKVTLSFMTKENMKYFSFYKKIKIYYLNYLNKKLSLNIYININWNLNDFVVYISKLYHIPYSKEKGKSVISVFIKNEQ